MYERLGFIIIFTMHLNATLSKKILAWYDNSKRILPWRVSKKSPKKLYYRLLSEFMLQQTQVKTVIPYFKKFTKNYKSLEKLSKANENQILHLRHKQFGSGHVFGISGLTPELFSKIDSKLIISDWDHFPMMDKPESYVSQITRVAKDLATLPNDTK